MGPKAFALRAETPGVKGSEPAILEEVPVHTPTAGKLEALLTRPKLANLFLKFLLLVLKIHIDLYSVKEVGSPPTHT